MHKMRVESCKPNPRAFNEFVDGFIASLLHAQAGATPATAECRFGKAQ
jgi:hypothetical protein